jgi:ABC-type lipopolysaccharide export system ATPase subunit
VDEEDITGLPMYQRARRGISYLPQEASVFRKLTVEENLMAILETLPMRARERRETMERSSSNWAWRRCAAAAATCSPAASGGAWKSPARW